MQRIAISIGGLLALLLLYLWWSKPSPGTVLEASFAADLKHLSDPGYIGCALKLDTLTPDNIEQLTGWAEAGHCLLVFDCQVAADFGFKPAPVKPSKAETTWVRYGWTQRSLAVVDATVTGSHPAVQGLSHFAIAAMLSADGTVAAVAPDPANTPLLLATDTHSIVAAVRPLGRGQVVFKPFVITTGDGTRFNAQLDAWCSGIHP